MSSASDGQAADMKEENTFPCQLGASWPDRSNSSNAAAIRSAIRPSPATMRTPFAPVTVQSAASLRCRSARRRNAVTAPTVKAAFERIAALVQHRNRAVSARVNADDGRSGHPTTVSRFARFVERSETISPAGLKTYTKTCQADASDLPINASPCTRRTRRMARTASRCRRNRRGRRSPPQAAPWITIASLNTRSDYPSPARSVVEARAPCYPTSEKIWQRCLKNCGHRERTRRGKTASQFPTPARYSARWRRAGDGRTSERRSGRAEAGGMVRAPAPARSRP